LECLYQARKIFILPLSTIFRLNSVRFLQCGIFVLCHLIAKDKQCYTVDPFIIMFWFLTGDMLVEFGRRTLQQIIGIRTGTNCTCLCAELFLFSFDVNFIQNLNKDKQIQKLTPFFIISGYIDYVLSKHFANLIPFLYILDKGNTIIIFQCLIT